MAPFPESRGWCYVSSLEKTSSGVFPFLTAFQGFSLFFWKVLLLPDVRCPCGLLSSLTSYQTLLFLGHSHLFMLLPKATQSSRVLHLGPRHLRLACSGPPPPPASLLMQSGMDSVTQLEKFASFLKPREKHGRYFPMCSVTLTSGNLCRPSQL